MRLAELTKAWGEYLATRDREVRDRLLLHYIPLAKQVVGQVMDRVGIALPPDLEYEDLLSYGILGLMDALDRFDLRRGSRFESYARLRIKGEVVDGLRSMDPVPRWVREKAGLIEKERFEMMSRMGRRPSDDEIAQQLGLSVAAVRRVLDDAGWRTVSLDHPLLSDDGGEEVVLGEAVADGSALVAEAWAENNELLEMLGDGIRRLSERERMVVALYYEGGLTMKQIAPHVGVSESMVSRVHSAAKASLRAHLESYVSAADEAHGNEHDLHG
jgi:RNA polymerase sigma factor for flagellar operon FliA